MAQFNLVKAETVLASVKEKPASDELHFVQELDDAGSAYHAFGCYPEAETCYTKVLELKRAHGVKDESALSTLHRLAILHRLQRKYPEAELAHLEAVNLAKELFGTNHPKVAEQNNYLAGLYHSFGRSEEAVHVMQESLDLYDAVEGAESPNVAICHFALALIYNKMKLQTESKRHYDRAHAITSNHLFGADETISMGLFGMAMYYFRQNDLDSAETLLRHSIILKEEGLWPFHPLVPKTLLKLGDFYETQQLLDKAELCYLSALQKQQVAFGEDHPCLLDTLTRLAKFYARQGDEQKAKDFGRQIILLEDI